MAASDYASTPEAADLFCLADGEAAVLLADHPWKRFAAVGDSVAEGLGDPVPGYSALPWIDRIAAELAAGQPDFAYRNFGTRDRRAAQVRDEQLGPALDFAPDLALVCAGGFDAVRPTYDPEVVDSALSAMVEAFHEHGADVITVGIFDVSHCVAVPDKYRPALGERMRLLSAHTRQVGTRYGTLHVDLTSHPAARDPAMYSADGLHGNLRSHAVCAAETIRRLGVHLGNTFTDRRS
jgi:lysophospholipase L1-like esterase